ncbi:50S ribosomal protein L11 [Candidatus Woesearchaeota archaeon]|nr:50S ribosomal protein L11 [Candidatus Woesearchaeota archaeon]
MATQTVQSLVEGGKATAGPPLGPSLGPLGVNIGQVVAEINRKTASFRGMQVPVKVLVDASTKEFEVTIGTPPASALVKKEANVEKGSANPLLDKVADLRIEQIIKIAKMKEDSLLGKALKQKVKEIVGTCNSMGILVEGKPAVDTLKDIDAGAFDTEISQEKTELTEEELKELEEEKKRLAEDIAKRRTELLAKAKTIIDSMAGKERSEIKGKLVQAGIPSVIIDELLPVEGAAAGAAPAAPGAAGAAKAPATGAAAKPEKAEKKAEKQEKK